MDLAASWTGDLGVQFYLFFVLVGHLFQEVCQRGTAVLAEVVSVLVGHSCSLRVDAQPASVQHAERGVKSRVIVVIRPMALKTPQ
jgi:hypothetical protein